MRVLITGEGPSAKALRSLIALDPTLVLGVQRGHATVRVEEADAITHPHVDGIDTDLELDIVTQLHRLGSVTLDGVVGRQGITDVIVIRIPRGYSEAQQAGVESAIHRGLLEAARPPQRPSWWRRLTTALGALLLLLVLSTPTAAQVVAVRDSVTGAVVPNIGDATNQGMRVTCVVGCGGGTVTANQGAPTSDAQSWPFHVVFGGVAIDPRLVTIQNASIAVTGTFFQATQPISGTVTANQGGAWSVGLSQYTPNSGRLPVFADRNWTLSSGTDSVAITAAALPLPSGAATEATLAGLLTNTQLRATPVPVSGPLTDAELRATPVPVSGTVTTGGLTDAQLRASPVPVSATNLDVRDLVFATDKVDVSGSTGVGVTGTFFQATQPVSNAGTFSVQCTSGCAGGSFLDNAAFTFGTTAVQPIGAVFDDVAPNAVTENAAAAPRLSSNRVLYGQIRDAAGNERGAHVTASNALKVDNSAVTQPVSGTFFQATQPVSIAATVTVTDPTFTDATGTTVPANAAFVAGTDGTTTRALTTNAAGQLLVNVLTTTGVVTTNLAQIDGFSPARDNGNSGVGTLRVTVANDSTGVLATVNNVATIGTSVTPGTGGAHLGKAEDGTATTGDVGVVALSMRNESTTLLTSASSEYVVTSADGYGVRYARVDHPTRTACNVSSTATTSAIVTGCLAPGAGLSIYITSLQWSSSIISTTTNFMTIQSGTGGNCGASVDVLYRGYQATALGNTNVVFQTPIKVPASEEVCLLHPGAGTRLVSIQGFIAP